MKLLGILYTGFLIYDTPPKLLSYSNGKKWLRHNYPKDLIYGNQNTTSVNCEHVIPRFLFKKYNIERRNQNDLHLLWLSDSRLNSQRQHFKFDLIHNDEPDVIFLDDFGKKTELQNYQYKLHTSSKRFEPNEIHRGTIARIVGYFYFIHKNECSDELLDIHQMIQWNKQYPVTQMEKMRNDKIYKIQHNKNIFIDYPFLMSIYFLYTPKIIRTTKIIRD